MTAPAEATLRPAQISHAVEELAEAAHWNDVDAKFRAGGGEIVTVVDTNIVHLFMDPGSETRHVDVYHAASGPEPDAATHLAFFAAATAEFIFLSKDLEVSGETSQLRRSPARIAPVHAEELLFGLQRLVRDTRNLLTNPSEIPLDEALQAVEDLRGALPTFGTLTSAEQLDRVARVTVALGRLFGPFLQLYRYNHLLRSEELLALAGHPRCTEDVLRPAFSEVEDWARELRPYKERRKDARTSPMAAANNDARALVQVMKLNSAAREDRLKLRFVLLTTDEGLHNVFRKRHKAGQVPGGQDPGAYVLRHPLQYGPVFNLKDIPNGVEDRRIFDRLKVSLNRARIATSGGSDWHRSADPDLIAGIQADWSGAIKTASVICAALAVRRFDRLFDQLKGIRRGPKGIGQLVVLQQRLLGQFEAGYLALHVQGVLDDVAAALQRDRRTPGLGPRRMPFLLRPNLFEPLGISSLREFLVEIGGEEAMAAHSPTARLNALMARLRDQPPELVAFLAGVVAAATDHFDRAIAHLERAEALAGQGATKMDRAELHYVTAVVRRLRMVNEGGMRRARALIDPLTEAREGGISFETARALVEAGTLRLVWCILPTLLSLPQRHTPEETARLLSEARQRLQRGLGQLPLIPHDAHRDDRERLPALAIQANTNMIALIAIEGRLLDPDAPLLRDAPAFAAGFRPHLEALDRAADAERGQRRDALVELWRQVASLLSEADPASRRTQAEELARFCDDRLKDLEEHAGDEHRASVDLALFARIHDRAGQIADVPGHAHPS